MRQAESGAADLVALAGELRPLLAKNAEQAERDRRLPNENVRALEARNLFKVRVRLSPGCAGRAPIRWLREMYSSQKHLILSPAKVVSGELSNRRHTLRTPTAIGSIPRMR